MELRSVERGGARDGGRIYIFHPSEKRPGKSSLIPCELQVFRTSRLTAAGAKRQKEAEKAELSPLGDELLSFFT